MRREQLLAEQSSIAFLFSKKVWSQQQLSRDYAKVNYADSSGPTTWALNW